MGQLIYAGCALTAFMCAWMLLRSYFRTRYRLLLWGGLCFTGLSLNNLLLVLDRIVFASIDFSTWRLLTALVAALLLLVGLALEGES